MYNIDIAGRFKLDKPNLMGMQELRAKTMEFYVIVTFCNPKFGISS